MELQAIISAGKGLYFDKNAEKAAKHVLGLPLLNIKYSKSIKVYFTKANKLGIEALPHPKGKNLCLKSNISDSQSFYQLSNISDPQTFFKSLSEKGYILIDSRITQDSKISKDATELKEDYDKTRTKLKHKPMPQHARTL